MGGLEEVAAEIKSARQAKALTQRELGERVGLPQSHISKIEGAGVDLQLSSLTEIARALDLEIKLVPRKALPAVEGAVRALRTTAETSRALAALAEQAELAKRLKIEFPELAQTQRFQEVIKRLSHVQFDAVKLRILTDLLKPLVGADRLLEGQGIAEIGKRLATAVSGLESLRSHEARQSPGESDLQLPAYRLEDDGE